MSLCASTESMCLCKKEVRLAQECGHCLVREIPARLVILHASFIITGLIQLRERESQRPLRTHTQHCTGEHSCPSWESNYLRTGLQGVWFNAEGGTCGNMAAFLLMLKWVGWDVAFERSTETDVKRTQIHTKNICLGLFQDLCIWSAYKWNNETTNNETSNIQFDQMHEIE